jgi:hypothetical protein
MDVPAGWIPFGEPVTVTLKRPCPACGYSGDVTTQPIVAALPGNARKLPVRCPQCGIWYELVIKQYADAVNWKPSASAAKRRGKAWSPRNHQLFARHFWCCVYHEGSAEAALFRRKQVESLELTVGASSLAASGDEDLFSLGTEVARAPEVDPNLFGLVPDHVIPKAIQELLDDRWSAQERELMSRDWIVAACGRCNRERNQELETSQHLLYIFSRFVLPHRPGDEIARLQETFIFVHVLETIERYRVETGIREPLRPLRLARKSESEAG